MDVFTVLHAARLPEVRAGGETYGTIELSEPLGLRQLRANLFCFRPGDRMEYHSHDWQEELLFILDGEGTVTVEGQARRVTAGDVLHFLPEPRRGLANDGARDLLWFAVGAPPVDEEWREWTQDSVSPGAGLAARWDLLHPDDLEPKVRDGYVISWLTEPLGLRQLRANLFRFRKGDEMYLHDHRTQEELFLLAAGEADLVVGSERRRLGPLDVVRVAPGVMRQLVQVGEEETVWLAVGAPPVDDDVVWAEGPAG
jgi:quercetin dioxygenase-like cupin family protein